MSDTGFLNSRGIFACSDCGEMIYSDAERCRFCSALVDREAAKRGAELQAQVNSACNQAKLLRNTAGVMWVFLGLSLILFLPFGLGLRFVSRSAALAHLLVPKIWPARNFGS